LSFPPAPQPLDHGDDRISRVASLPPRLLGDPSPAASGYLSDPRSHALLKRLRRTLDARPLQRLRCCLPTPGQGRHPQRLTSELITRPATSLSTLRRFGYPHGARLASGWRPPLAGRDFNPLGPFGRFQKLRSSSLTHVISSPFPRLRLAHAWHVFVFSSSTWWASRRRSSWTVSPGSRSRSVRSSPCSWSCSSPHGSTGGPSAPGTDRPTASAGWVTVRAVTDGGIGGRVAYSVHEAPARAGIERAPREWRCAPCDPRSDRQKLMP
jgi:hypothetical protein